jgi:DNA processing protein
MDETRTAAVVLAALEQVPGEPADLTRILRDPYERQFLLGVDHHVDGWSSEELRPFDSAEAPSELVQFLVDSLDNGRIEHWAKVIERGVRDDRYRCHVAGDQGYPARLNYVWDAPPIVFTSWASFASGPAGARAALAVVGGRETSRGVLEATHQVAFHVSEQGVDVVSGLAAGVDTAAHLAALAAGGPTIAVLGTGIERVFPEENTELAARISERGTMLSQFVPNAPRTGTTFLRRNSVIAAISDASLIMDGRARSGSRHEIEQAIRYSKPVLMWRPALGAADWARRLESAGVATYVESPEEVLQFLP